MSREQVKRIARKGGKASHGGSSKSTSSKSTGRKTGRSSASRNR